MVKLTISQNEPYKGVDLALLNKPRVTFYVDQDMGKKCEADYFATPSDSRFGHTELNLVFSSEQSVEKIEELCKVLEKRINEFTGGATWFVQIAEAVTEGLDDYNVVAHSSYVPS